ncbi:hypothetical protein ACS7SF_02720 [Ralstonia sp. 25C]|uniref:hypothetical protein n=1 Tax=Ralstonia sp. 25C TaxID=3447363 RepID=UPI003F754F3E
MPEVTEKTGQRNVFWTAQERAFVAAEALKISIKNKSLTEMKCIRMAQAKLPAERQRPNLWDWPAASKWVLPLWAQLLELTGAGKTMEEALTVMTEPGKAPAPVEQVEEVKAEPVEHRGLVRWNNAERKQIARRMYHYMQAGETRLDALRAAVRELPKERQRTINTMSLVGDWIDEALTEAARNFQSFKEREAIEQAQSEYLAQEQAAAVQRGIEERMTAMTLEDCVRMMAQKAVGLIVADIEKAVDKAISARIANMPGVMASPVLRASLGIQGVQAENVRTVPRDHRPRVCVVGLLNQQEQDVKHAFGDALEFVFVKSQGTGGSGAHGGHGMLERGARCDLVISMVNFNGHDVDKAAKKLNVPFVRVNGSVSALKKWLTSWMNGEVALHHERTTA